MNDNGDKFMRPHRNEFQSDLDYQQAIEKWLQEAMEMNVDRVFLDMQCNMNAHLNHAFLSIGTEMQRDGADFEEGKKKVEFAEFDYALGISNLRKARNIALRIVRGDFIPEMPEGMEHLWEPETDEPAGEET